jgi:hypothetical protein
MLLSGRLAVKNFTGADAILDAALVPHAGVVDGVPFVLPMACARARSRQTADRV